MSVRGDGGGDSPTTGLLVRAASRPGGVKAGSDDAPPDSVATITESRSPTDPSKKQVGILRIVSAFAPRAVVEWIAVVLGTGAFLDVVGLLGSDPPGSCGRHGRRGAVPAPGALSGPCGPPRPVPEDHPELPAAPCRSCLPERTRRTPQDSSAGGGRRAPRPAEILVRPVPRRLSARRRTAGRNVRRECRCRGCTPL